MLPFGVEWADEGVRAQEPPSKQNDKFADFGGYSCPAQSKKLRVLARLRVRNSKTLASSRLRHCSRRALKSQAGKRSLTTLVFQKN